MNKLKNNIIRSIPNLNQEGPGKILSAFKQNEMSGNKTTKHLEIDLKHKINSSIRENIASLSSERVQPKKSKKLDEKVETIVDMIKQDLLPMLEMQNQKIERLERRYHNRKESATEKELRESLLQELKTNQTVENDVQNLSVSVDEIKKNLTNLDNLVKYQFLKRKNKSSETEDISYKSQINQLQIRLNTEIIESKMQQRQTTQEIQQYMAIQLQEIKDWINQYILDKQQEAFQKVNQLENQIYQYLQQPFEILRKLQESYTGLQQKINQKTLLEYNDCQICFKTTQQEKIYLNCGHQFHEDCLFTSVSQQMQNNEQLHCTNCKIDIKLNQLRQKVPNSELLDSMFRQQLRQLIQTAQSSAGHCKNCGYIFICDNGQSVEQCGNCQ